MKKRFSFVLCTLLLSLLIVTPVSAEEQQQAPQATIKIVDPVTNETWKWNVEAEDITIQDKILSRTALGNELHNAQITINVKDYLQDTFKASESGSSTVNSDITLTTGMTYSYNASNSTVQLYNVFGSTTPKGLYYATDREVHWRHPGAGISNRVFYPSSNNWNQPVSASGYYETSTLAYPHCMLKCDVHISGMTSYRTLYAEFHLNYL